MISEKSNVNQRTIIIGIFLILFFCGATSYAKEEAEILIQTGHTDVVSAVAFSPDGQTPGQRAVDDQTSQAVGRSKTAAKARDSFAGHTDQVRSVAFSPDGHDPGQRAVDDRPIGVLVGRQHRRQPRDSSTGPHWVGHGQWPSAPMVKTLASGSYDQTTASGCGISSSVNDGATCQRLTLLGHTKRSLVGGLQPRWQDPGQRPVRIRQCAVGSTMLTAASL